MEMLRDLAQNGMDAARLNMTHGDHAWHAAVIERLREINRSGCGAAQALRGLQLQRSAWYL
jgi:pyruvate kinase